jgi:RecA-family ATPase
VGKSSNGGLTAQTGAGKTAIAMRWAGHVVCGLPLHGLDVEKGTVLYFAGENTSDIQARWLALTQEMRLDPATADIHHRRHGSYPGWRTV